MTRPDPDTPPIDWNPLPVVLADSRLPAERAWTGLFRLLSIFLLDPLILMLCFGALHVNHQVVPDLSLRDAIFVRIIFGVLFGIGTPIEWVLGRYSVRKGHS